MATRAQRTRAAASYRRQTYKGNRAIWAARGVTWTNKGSKHTVKMDLKWDVNILRILQAMPQEIAEEVGRQIAEEARILAQPSVRTGALQAGIKMTSTKRGVFVRVRPLTKIAMRRRALGRLAKTYTSQKETLAETWRRQVYPVFVEFGTQHMSAHPFLRPAKALVEKRIPDIARGRFRQDIGG